MNYLDQSLGHLARRIAVDQFSQTLLTITSSPATTRCTASNCRS